jgi:hypothetical protein
LTLLLLSAPALFDEAPAVSFLFNRTTISEPNNVILVDLLADKIGGRSNKGNFDQAPSAASTRVETSYVVLAKEPATSTGERRR